MASTKPKSTDHLTDEQVHELELQKLEDAQKLAELRRKDLKEAEATFMEALDEPGEIDNLWYIGDWTITEGKATRTTKNGTLLTINELGGLTIAKAVNPPVVQIVTATGQPQAAAEHADFIAALNGGWQD